MAHKITQGNFEKADEKTEKERLIEIVDALQPNIEFIERLVSLIKKYQLLLSEPKLLFKYRRGWISLLMAMELYNAYQQNKVNAEYAQSVINKIKTYDEELAYEIKRLLPTVDSHPGIFSDLFSAYFRGKDYLVSYISTNVQELITRARSMNNQELSKKLIRLFSSISGSEISYLARYGVDCENWVSVRYSVNYEIDFFARRLDLYIKGGIESNQQFMGLYKDFGDTKLTEDMLKDAAVRNLWRYREQLRYIDYLIGLCRKSEASGKWEGFYGKDGFWGKEGDKKGKNFDRYANEFEIKYGNKVFADTLKAKKWKIGESPAEWGGLWDGNRLLKPGLLQRLSEMLQNPQYQRPKIIAPASLALQELLKKRGDELAKSKDKSIDELLAILPEFAGLGQNMGKMLKMFRRLLEKRKWRLSKQARDEINELMGKSANLLVEYDNFAEHQKVAMAKADLEFRMSRMRRLAASAMQHSNYTIIKQKGDDFLRNPGELVRVDGADGAAREAYYKIYELLEFKHLEDSDFKEMERLVPESAEIIKKLRKFAVTYLKKEVDTKFTITIDDLDNLSLKAKEPQQKSELQKAA